MPRPRPEILRLPTAVHGGRAALATGTEAPLTDFSVCLNAFGPAACVRAAIAASPIDEYPDPSSRAARAAAGAHWQRPPEEIVLGAGSVELIQALCLAYLAPGDSVLVATPCFSEYARFASLCGASVQTAHSLEELAHRITPNVRMVFVASPSSPLGLQVPLEVLRQLADACAAADALLVLDQAYDGFTAAPHGTPALPGHAHVVHLRSMTKDHALASVRVAFAVAAPDVADALERARIPWVASGAAQAAAVALLTEEAQAHARTTTRTLREEAARVRDALRRRGFDVAASDTHYLLIPCDSASHARAWLLEHERLLVRDCTSFGLPRHIRVAARRPAENDVLIDALTRLRSTFTTAMS